MKIAPWKLRNGKTSIMTSMIARKSIDVMRNVQNALAIVWINIIMKANIAQTVIEIKTDAFLSVRMKVILFKFKLVKGRFENIDQEINRLLRRVWHLVQGKEEHILIWRYAKGQTNVLRNNILVPSIQISSFTRMFNCSMMRFFVRHTGKLMDGNLQFQMNSKRLINYVAGLALTNLIFHKTRWIIVRMKHGMKDLIKSICKIVNIQAKDHIKK